MYMNNKPPRSAKRILAVFAHPDDETFGPGGTLLTWAKKGYEIHLLCVTHGENGMNNTKHHTAHVRERELKKAAKILGIARVEFLDFIDGTIGNHDIPRLREKITAKIRTFQPHRILTFFCQFKFLSTSCKLINLFCIFNEMVIFFVFL